MKNFFLLIKVDHGRQDEKRAGHRDEITTLNKESQPAHLNSNKLFQVKHADASQVAERIRQVHDEPYGACIFKGGKQTIKEDTVEWDVTHIQSGTD